MAKEGVVELRTGAELEIVKLEPADVLPLHVTVTGIVPGLAISAPNTRVVKVVLLMNVADFVMAPQPTEQAVEKFEPVKVKVNAELPAVALEGERRLSTGLRVMGGGEDPPPPPQLIVNSDNPLRQASRRSCIR
jgi:hypothetical protein